MKQLILVRHGQAAHHTEGLTGGWTDRPLTAKGLVQATATAVKITELCSGLTVKLLCSDLQRAVQTIAPIAERLPGPVTKLPGLRELNNGQAANLSTAEAQLIAYRRVDHQQFVDWRHYPGAETWREFYQRVAQTMQWLLTITEDTAVMVTHKGTIVVAVAWWLLRTTSPINNWQFSCDAEPASITILRINQRGEWTVSKLNDTSHLQYKN